MKLSYNVTGAERKSLVGAISAALNEPTKYLGAPTFAYEVGGYHIDKVGTLTGADNLDLEDALHQAGFDADGDTREYDEPDTYESGISTPPDKSGGDPEGGMGALPTPEELEAEVYAEREMRRMKLEAENVPDYSNRGQYGGDEIPAYEDLNLTEGEELGLGQTRREDFHGENGMRADDVPEPDQLVIEVPLTGFTPEKLDNLVKLVNAKAPLLKAALGTEDLPIQQTDEDGGKLRFPWFGFGDPLAYDHGDKVRAYATLIEKLCKAAKEKHRVTAKEKDIENPKYAMRCWLLSLGFIGDEYKASRKILLANLDGNSSFKGGSRPTYTAHCYTYPNGSEEDAMDCETFEFTSLKSAKAKCDEFLADCENVKFAGCHVEGDSGDYLYEILTDGTVNEK